MKLLPLLLLSFLSVSSAQTPTAFKPLKFNLNTNKDNDLKKSIDVQFSGFLAALLNQTEPCTNRAYFKYDTKKTSEIGDRFSEYTSELLKKKKGGLDEANLFQIAYIPTGGLVGIQYYVNDPVYSVAYMRFTDQKMIIKVECYY